MTLTARTGIAVVDLYLAKGRRRAEMNMQGFSRLSDVFNNAPGEFIAATVRMAATSAVESGLPERRSAESLMKEPHRCGNVSRRQTCGLSEKASCSR